MRHPVLLPLLAGALLAAAAPAFAVNLPSAGTDKPRAAALPDDWLEDVETPAEVAKEDMREGDARRWEESQASAAGSAQAPVPGVDCPKPSGTTGAILGAVAGGILGNIIDGGRHRAIGTLAGAGGGALLGRSIEQKSGKCQ
ncbi:glycine zipper 2TM domain-containing protein [Rhizorhabdus dicambivorans]|uniref:17 kDa surface antigen n=1 Tax=Rhizorhabdus dicambivorans TaxID=1850238 RepID=A0A2A4FPJ8_9SPHN|nr:glycine zipper 2TM domain-containing protein [Rhizorhabdus dicambivorans]ATE66486.1 glycine zipper 2TM domain-containing protein [Rhizorhabdus dicambivorans]PCE39632.1 glycine zipper 2TM domain-containing protein [Rhizorhabdus dicambivorans]